MRWLIVEKCSASYSSFQTRLPLFAWARATVQVRSCSPAFPSLRSSPSLHCRTLRPSVRPSVCPSLRAELPPNRPCGGSLRLAIGELGGGAASEGRDGGFIFPGRCVWTISADSLHLLFLFPRMYKPFFFQRGHMRLFSQQLFFFLLQTGLTLNCCRQHNHHYYYYLVTIILSRHCFSELICSTF